MRGAVNKISLLSMEERSNGIVTGSAGNHGLGVAYASSCLDIQKVDIFVPGNAPKTKLDKIEPFPAKVHISGSTYEDAHQAAAAFSRESGALEIPAYDDLDVIAGQGTIGLEILSELPDVSLILVPVGGGGLIAGIASAAIEMKRDCRIIGVQPEASPAALLSFREGVPHDPYDHAPTIADGLAGGFGAIPFYLARTLVERILLVDERSMRYAIFKLLEQEQIVVEASAAASVAPLLQGEFDVAGETVVCIVTGGNLPIPLLREILNEFAE